MDNDYLQEHPANYPLKVSNWIVWQISAVVWKDVLLVYPFNITPYAYALNTSRTFDVNEYYTSNYSPFNILHELENNYMDLNIADVKFQGELKWKIIQGLELSDWEL